MVRTNFDLSKITWFKVGGLAENFSRTSTLLELQHIVQSFPQNIIIGNTSNILFSDKILQGCVIKLGSAFGKVEHLSNTKFRVGSSCLNTTLAKYMQGQGISGMEFLATIPGTVGGNIAMNAGCFGSEIFDILESVEILHKGKVLNVLKEEIPHTYRSATLPNGSIILSAILNGVESTPAKIQSTINAFVKKRTDAQPQNVRTGGSTFKNPSGYTAWELIRKTGAHKLQVGGAKVSEKHSNFLINDDNATAMDIFTLGEQIRTTVLKETGIALEWEIQRIGFE
ncbi:MAG: UDP-N-acetylmuramate dehydrogenase [Candidatus Deianiraeaceae bacterium]|jgi:UDP-N-acetylmuramate dehydrogenase